MISMKKFFILLILVTATLLSSCNLFKNDEDPKPLHIMGGVEGKLNGANITKLFPIKYQRALARYMGIFKESPEPISIYLGLYDTDNVLKGSLAWSKYSTSTGRFEIVDDKYGDLTNSDQVVKAEYGTLIGGDVSGNSYKIIPSPYNYFILESYDEKSRELRGSFQVTFEFVGGCDVDFRDTLRFTEGKFHTRLFTKKELLGYD